MITYRLSDHTTADDASRYREDEEVEAAWKREPISRLRTYLEAQGAWGEQQERDLLDEAARQVADEVAAYEAMGMPTVESMFDYMYGDMPADLAAQRDRAIEESG
jgi:2-oxoisovalerate dehydrogenase E1 component alpha subunit